MSLTWSPELLRRQTKAKGPAQSRADANGTILALHNAPLHVGNAIIDKQQYDDDGDGDVDGDNAMVMAMTRIIVT